MDSRSWIRQKARLLRASGVSDPQAQKVHSDPCFRLKAVINMHDTTHTFELLSNAQLSNTSPVVHIPCLSLPAASRAVFSKRRSFPAKYSCQPDSVAQPGNFTYSELSGLQSELKASLDNLEPVSKRRAWDVVQYRMLAWNVGAWGSIPSASEEISSAAALSPPLTTTISVSLQK